MREVPTYEKLQQFRSSCRWATPGKCGSLCGVEHPYLFAEHVYSPIYNRIDHRTCRDRPWLWNSTRASCKRELLPLPLLQIYFPRGLLVIGDSLAEQWYVMLLTTYYLLLTTYYLLQTTDYRQLTTYYYRYVGLLRAISYRAGLPARLSSEPWVRRRPWPFCTNQNGGNPHSASFGNWSVDFLRQDCPAFDKTGPETRRAVKQYDAIFVGGSLAHLREECDPQLMESKLLHSVVQHVAEGTPIALLEKLPHYWANRLPSSPPLPPLLEPCTDSETVVLPAPAISNNLQQSPTMLSQEVTRKLQGIYLSAPLHSPIPPMAPNRCATLLSLQELQEREQRDFAALEQRVRTLRTRQRIYVFVGVSELFFLRPELHVGDDGLRMPNPTIDCTHRCVPALDVLGLSIIDLLSQVSQAMGNRHYVVGSK